MYPKPIGVIDELEILIYLGRVEGKSKFKILKRKPRYTKIYLWTVHIQLGKEQVCH